MVWMTPIFPFKNPPSALPTSAIQMFVAKPTMTILSIVPIHPISRIGFRPTRSLREPQNMPVKDSASAKALMSRPA